MLEAFFSELVSSRLQEPVRSYVVSVLIGFVRVVPSNEPLCLRLGDVSPHRVLVLKEVGDEALFVSGFLLGPEPDYYARIGSVAYGELSVRIRDPLFRTLAAEFSRVQGALRAVRRNFMLDGLGPMALVDEWAQRGSEVSWGRLRRFEI